jgi:hypothetical protein
VVRDVRDHPFLLLVGFDRFDGGRPAVVRVSIDRESLLTARRYEFGAPVSLVPADSGIGSPTDLVPTPGGVFVWDPAGPSLFRLEDVDGDRLPDRLDPTDRLSLSDRDDKRLLGRRAEAEWTGNCFLFRVRVGNGWHAGEWPFVLVGDPTETVFLSDRR